MNTLRDQAQQWLRDGIPAYLVEMVSVAGSAPREAGTRMLVAAQAVAGTIGGGRLEFEAIRLARHGLRGTDEFQRHFALGPSLGQCCGGAVSLRFAPLRPAEVERWPSQAPLFRLQLYGAGHVGRELVSMLERLPVNVQWIDERDDEFELFRQERLVRGVRDWPANVQMTSVDAVTAEVDQAAPGSFFLVLTHSHDLDLALCEAVLARGDAGFLGVIGSRTKRARFIARLRAKGFAEQSLRELHCPIGIAGVESKLPEVIAAAVVAQLLVVAQARTVQPVVDRLVDSAG